jgi:hypothetical protein
MGAFLNEPDSSLEIDTRDPVARMKLSAAVSERRASLVKYVMAAVCLAVLLCAAAVVKVAVARTEKTLPSPAWVAPLPSAPTAVPGAPESTRDMASPQQATAGASTPVVPLDPKAAAKAAKEKAKTRGKTGVDRGASAPP